jgi:hypothetical protein
MQVFIDNVDLTANLALGSLRITLKANGVRSASLSLIDTLQRVHDGSDLRIFDNGQLLFGGIVNSVSGRFITPITEQFPLVQYDASSDGYNYIASRRTVNLYYQTATAGAIAQDLRSILSTDSITSGTISNGADVTQFKAQYKSVKEILDDLASVSGYVWYIDNERRLQFVEEQGVSNAPYELVRNGTFTDFNGLSWSGSLVNYANRVIVLGGNGSNGDQVILSKDEPDEIAERTQEAGGLSSGIYGAVVQDSNVRSQFWANVVADTHLRKYAIRQSTLAFSSFTPGWRPAQRLKVQIPQITGFPMMGPANIWYYLIESVDITFEPGDIVRYTMNCTRRKTGNFTSRKSAGFREYFETLVKKG